MIKASLCLLIKGDKEILLAMKKKGFGKGKWNGVGGKFDIDKDKNMLETAIRETKEEIGVNLNDVEKVAVISFKFPYKEEWNQEVHVFLAKSWNGEPRESEEMTPKWFTTDKLPFDEMWDDDKFWLPKILDGKKLEASFTFSPGEKINKYIINTV